MGAGGLAGVMVLEVQELVQKEGKLVGGGCVAWLCYRLPAGIAPSDR